MADKVKVGNRVEVIGKDVRGKVAFIGLTQFSSGKWYGVVLDEPKGKNDGTVQGKSYFTCPDKHGIFVRSSQLQVIDEDGMAVKNASPASSASPAEVTPSATPKEGENIPKRKSSVIATPKFHSDKQAKDAANLAETPGSQPGSKRESIMEGDSIMSSKVTTSLSSAASILEEKMNLLHKDQEIEQLKGEIKDLSEKLETIKIKRSEDQSKLKELEKTKLQVQTLQEYKTKITEVQNDLQRQLSQAKKEAKEAIEAREQHADEMSDLAEAMELATLDKEMAEEKCETLQAELEHTKEKLEEMQIDLEILKAEMSEKGTDGAATSYQVKQLEQQNERLKEALVKMRDLSAHEKQEQQRNLKEIERQKSEIAELSRTKEKLSSQVEEYENQIAELKEQVDAALGCEEMVEQLSERNLTLEDKVRELQVIIDEQERLLDVNEQLQESAKETELELREEVDMANVKVMEAGRKLEAMQEAIADYEQTIMKFREQTEQLRDANHELQMQLQKESDRVAMATPVEFFDFKVKYAETKAFARAVEMDLRRLEVQESNQHVTYLCSFMPDNFLTRGSDHDSLLVLLLIPRIITKAEILISQIKEKFPTPEEVNSDIVLKSHKIDQSTFANRLLYKLFYLQSLMHQYKSALNNCSIELFMKIGTLYMEMAVQEKAIDYYIDLLRKDQLDENINLDTLERALNYFQSLYNVHLSAEKVSCSALMADHMKLLMSAADSIYLDIMSVKCLVDKQTNEFVALLKDVCTYADDIRQFVKKIRRRLPTENSSVTLLFGADIQEQLAECREQLGQVMSAAFLLRKSAVQQVVMSGEAAFVSMEKIKELAHESTDKAYGKDDSGPECMRQSMNDVMVVMNKLANAMQEGEFDVDSKSEAQSIPPVLLRAQAVKSEAKDLESLKFKIEAREGDIMELKKALKIKSDELSEMHVRKEMAEKKLEISTKDSDERIERIQRQLDEAKMMLKKKEKEFEETLDHLQADIDALETERGELKDKLKMMSKKALFEGLSKTSALAGLVASPTSPTVPSVLSAGPHFSRETSLLSQQVEDLQLALKNLKNENMRLQSNCILEQLSGLPPLKLPSKPTGLQSTTGFVNVVDIPEDGSSKCKTLVDLAKKSAKLLEESSNLTCPLVVDISHRKPAASPITDSAQPKSQLIDSVSKTKSLQKEAERLKWEVSNLKAALRKGAQVTSDFASFPTPTFAKTLEEKEQLLGKISLKSGCGESGVIPLYLSMKEIRQIHTKLVC